ncbi:aconitate hydratase AcnA [Anaplasma phagocytophilum]|uniref:aconitate hydratase AcnA n=1 Tax=Anaplasma phagocytophilum TaxID=948 RepID=UPI002010B884|nr:aconitate hydratase AcnA [Anaplasma phagocytophilum]UQD54429.1 aconitate hydratase AcnA [Anaplasma phagocytophilum]
MTCLDTLQVRKKLCVAGVSYDYYALDLACQKLGLDIASVPFVYRILLENLLRNEDGLHVKLPDIERFAACVSGGDSCEVNFMPARVMMQDFTGVPALVDLASMRDFVKAQGKDPSIINPRIPVDLVVDHSLQVDFSGTEGALAENVALEMSRNLERYQFLKWSQQAFRNLRVVPPGTGICHQVNLEYLAKVVWNHQGVLYPDTLIGTDSHTTMINGISVLGWGVGGIEAEAAMLGQPIVMSVPEVVGFEILGALKEGVTATDMVLTITEILRSRKVVGKFVEFYGEGLKNLSAYDRATVANMAPEYGATCGFFPFDQSTLDYLYVTGRDREYLDVVEQYMRTQGLWCDNCEVSYSEKLTLNLEDILPVVAGPKRPQDKLFLAQIPNSLPVSTFGEDSHLPVKNGDVVVAAITSCTNTSNPYVMVAAGIVARKARKLGLKTKPWVKTSLTPGSQVVAEYLKISGLQDDLNLLGFNIVGYGCATCIGNSGPLSKEIEECVQSNNLLVASVLSGNRNFEGRIHPSVKANFLASPPLVVIFSLSGTVLIDVTKDPICEDARGKPVYMQDLWPTTEEIAEIVNKFISRDMFVRKYSDVFLGDAIWERVESKGDFTYSWSAESTYVQLPPYFTEAETKQKNIEGNALKCNSARVLMLLGDSITTDHISPAGNIAAESPAGKFLLQSGVKEGDFNSYGSRRGNHNVMIRGTFANIRIKNEMLSGVEGGFTRHYPSQEVLPIFDAAMRYSKENTPLVIIAGKEYGTGSSRDWAAKGTLLLGLVAVIAESFERIHRSNLVGMGVLPLIFKDESRSMFSGDETLTLYGEIGARKEIKCEVRKSDGTVKTIALVCAVNTAIEVDYLSCGGVLHYVLNRMVTGQM